MAKDFAEKYLGPTDDITVNLTNIYERAKNDINIQLQKVKDLEEK